jgi:hypothetical protein
VISELSGLVALAVMVEGVPAGTVAGFAEQLTCGGFIGFTFTVKVAAHMAEPFFIFGSAIVALAV